MTNRALVGVLVLFGLTAFAPAPFPRTGRDRRSESLSLEQMQGTWHVTKMQTTRRDGRHNESPTALKEIVISGSTWSFVYSRGRNEVRYTIRIDPNVRPPQLDFYHLCNKDTGPYGRGILKRDGNSVQLMYNWSGDRAISFEQPPDGHWLITMQRAR